jgi:hypothetical protein
MFESVESGRARCCSNRISKHRTFLSISAFQDTRFVGLQPFFICIFLNRSGKSTTFNVFCFVCFCFSIVVAAVVVVVVVVKLMVAMVDLVVILVVVLVMIMQGTLRLFLIRD